MQEVFKNGTEGEIHVENTIEDLVPHIRKSLLDPNVKYVKVFAKTVNAKVKFNAEEEKKNVKEKMEEILEIDEKGDVVKKE